MCDVFQNHRRLQDISTQFKETSKSFNEIFEDANDSFDVSYVYSRTSISFSDNFSFLILLLPRA